jgi:hypothetical protein
MSALRLHDPMTETATNRLIQQSLSTDDVRLFRNSTGAGWIGDTFSVRNGQLISGNARRVTFGLCPGSSDLIGLRGEIITEDHLGQRFARFVAIEGKSTRGRISDEQQNFITMVNNLGGIGGVARSVEEAAALLGIKT